MSRDWPDPRFPDKPISPLEIALATFLVVGSYAGTIWMVMDGIRRIFG